MAENPRWAAYKRDMAARHAAEVAAGKHDDQCEVRPADGYSLCHCSKRRREAAGFTTPPGDLDFPPPYCPRCLKDCNHDGDVWRCDGCSVSWSSDGTGAMFTDDYGDLTPKAAR